MKQRRWPRGAECQCSECGAIFTSATGFDRHRARRAIDGRCIYPAVQTDGKGRPIYKRHRTADGQTVWKLNGATANPHIKEPTP